MTVYVAPPPWLTPGTIPPIRAMRDHEEALAYFREEVEPKLAPKLACFRSAFARDCVDIIRSATYTGASSVVKLAGKRMKRVLGVHFPWHTRFYEHTSYEGDDFALGALVNTNPVVAINPLLANFDWDDDLTTTDGPNSAGNWNDTVSSVECVSVAKYTLLCEHVKFGGDSLLMNGDHPDLRQAGWNDKTSSVIMCSIPGVVIDAGLKAVLQGL